MNLAFTPHAWDDYLWWQRNDKAVAKRINLLIQESLRDPYDGIGKPEPLRHVLQGTMSRRITQEHRMVYLVADDELVIIQLRFHYR